MPTPRRLFAVLAAVSLAAGLVVGCSASKKTAAPLPDAANLVRQCSQATKDVTSVHLVLSTTGKIKKLPVKTLTGDLTTKPSTAAKGNAKLSMGGSDVDAQFVVYGGRLYAALTGDLWSDFGPAADIYDPASILNPDTGLANVLAHLSDPKAESRETLNGQDTIRISGKVPADTVNQLAPQLKADQPMPITVWIQENGNHELVQAKLSPSADNSIQMTLSNWNEPVTVTKPSVTG
ncbi:LppX_LprAFG lipoprotein [Mycobacterium sp.]|uniref:LppX_LprAFG lipoprotein n=1 Tax=Mycobacterium sp. TaxID=1785 RepID=UPI00126D4784|nr:LppX_LprAFG lipoprotein [Mycobacterium sp.]KAA8968188.1 MAG: LppX_LprAFG lipoprotein [Mycobacterium sp.]